MYLIRRVFKTQPGKAPEVAGHVVKMCQAYTQAGRNPATVYISGQGVPGTPNIVYADWTQERIEQTVMERVPEAVGTEYTKIESFVTDSYLEFYEVAT